MVFFIHTSMISLYCARSHQSTSHPLLPMPPDDPCDVAHRREHLVEPPVRQWVPCVSWEFCTGRNLITADSRCLKGET